MSCARLRLALALVSSFCLPACGTAVSVDPHASAGSTSGSSTGPTVSSGATSGGGSCSAEGLVFEAVAIPGSPDEDQRRPQLVALDGDAKQVALVYSTDSTASPPGLEPDPIWSLAFEPFGKWPPALGVAGQATKRGGSVFAAGPGASAGSFDLASFLGPPATSQASQFFEGVPPGGSVAPDVTTANDAVALFVGVRNGAQRLAGLQLELGGYGVEAVGFDAAGVSYVAARSSCADVPAAAAAAPLGQGFLMAQASSEVFPACATHDGLEGSPTRLELLSVGGETPTFLDAVTGSDPITGVAVTPRSDGAWVFSQRQGQSKVDGSVVVQRVDPAGHFEGPSFDVVPPGHASSFQAAAIGDGFVVAWVDSQALSVSLTVYDGAGSHRYDSSLAPPGFGPAEGTAAIVARPTGDGVVAVSLPSLDGAPARIGLLRFGCEGG